MRRGLDANRLAETIRRPGTDTRHWCSHGTVGVVDDAGKLDLSDPQAVVVASDGVWCDVYLEPLGVPVTARLALGVGARCSILCPIKPGDEVLVVLPDGDFNNPPAIVAILNNLGAKIPIASDGKPVFRNDRLSVYAGDVPVEVRTASGAIVRLETDGAINMVPASGKLVGVGAMPGSDTEAAALGDTIQDFLAQIRTWANSHVHTGVTTGVFSSGAAATQVGPVPDVTSSNVQVKK